MIIYAAILGGVALGGAVNLALKRAWRRLRAPGRGTGAGGSELPGLAMVST
jgi:hypothetical protein